MGIKDHTLKTFFRQKQEFAKVINCRIFGGKNVVNPEELQDCTPEQPELQTDGRTEKWKGVSHFRDLMKRGACCMDGQRIYLMLGLEGQVKQSRFMPVRMLGYDIREYERQIAQREFLQENSAKNIPLLTPVVSLVINMGNEAWKYPRRLSTLFPHMPSSLRKLIAHYTMQLLDPHTMPDREIEKYGNEIKYVFYVIKYGKNKGELLKILHRLQGQVVNGITAKCLEALLGLPKGKIHSQEGGTTKMCQAMQEILKDYTLKGEKRGVKIGEKRGVKIGEKRGVKIGEKRGVKIGEKRGVKIGEKRGVKIGEKGALQKIVRILQEQNFTEETIQTLLAQYKKTPA